MMRPAVYVPAAALAYRPHQAEASADPGEDGEVWAMRAWHFSDGPKCQYSDEPIVVGQTLRHKGGLRLCTRGYHASRRIIDALAFASGSWIWRVEVSGEIIHGDDKLVARERTALWGFDAEDVLRRFARLCALDVIHLWDAPEVVVRYLKTGDEAIRAAAKDAARDAAYGAARVAAWDAAWSAQWAAVDLCGAKDAAWAAARDAAWDAASGAANDAARAAQNRRLTSMVTAGARKRDEKGLSDLAGSVDPPIKGVTLEDMER